MNLKKHIFKEFDIDGFVGKGHGDAQQMKKAILSINQNQKYISTESSHYLCKNTIEPASIEITILQFYRAARFRKTFQFIYRKRAQSRVVYAP